MKIYYITTPTNGFSSSKIRDVHLWRDGYIAALRTYGIWKNGTLVIGCMNTPIRECIPEIHEYETI